MISVVVCTKDRCDNLLKFLPSLLNQTYKHFEVIILDNGSIDNTKNIINQFRKKYDNLRYFYYPKKGFAIFRQYACNKAKGDIITSLDDDCVVEKDFLQKIRESFKKNKNAAIVGGNVINIGFIGKAKWKGLGKLDKYGYYQAQQNRNKATIFGSANLSIRKSVFQEVGGFDPLFYVLEEADLCYKVRQRGYELIYNPMIEIKHYHIPKQNHLSVNLLHKIKSEELRFYLFLKYLYPEKRFSFIKLLYQEILLFFRALYKYNKQFINKSGYRNKKSQNLDSNPAKKSNFFMKVSNMIIGNIALVISRFSFLKYFLLYLKIKSTKI